MFEQSILPSGKTRNRWTISIAIAAELAIVGVLLLVPLIFVQSLPMADIASILTLPPPPPAPAPPPPPAAARVKVTPRQFKLNVFTAPVTIPKAPVIVQGVADVPDLATSPAGVVGGVPGGVPNGMLGGVLGSIGTVAPPPPPPPPPPAPVVTPTRIQVGGQVQAAKLIKQVLPKYPKLAHDARLGGVVRLRAVIAKDGTVEDLSVISGHPILIPAALDAVKHWIYKPTILNGVAIEIGTEIDVTFQLST